MKLVETGFKLRFMLTFCIITITAVSMASLLFYFLTYRELSHDYGEAFFTLQSVKRAIFPLLFASIQSITLLTVVSIAIAVISLFFSHKIAGPLYRFEQSMEAVGSGDLTCVVRLRAGDQFMRLENTMCTSINSMNQRVTGMNDVLLRFKAIEERLKTVIEMDPQQKELKELTEDLRSELTELKRIMATIKMEW
ncbi:MAG: hypothetical protein A2Z47_09510 [Thermodesulfovibrio sp. RBG_19FT_COMBO_42_12]|nr:MAG: hypothetical protein A2Z47_09510 [Thermodesulfovibrio sp. RBG_19FT_COMBO_42_12]